MVDNLVSVRKAFYLIDKSLYEKNPNSFKVSMDGPGLFSYTAEKDSNKIIDIGISEQLAYQVLFGLSIKNSEKVYLSGMTSFLLRRAYEQLKLYINDESPNVTIIGYGSGFSYGNLGPSHFSEDDLGIFSLLKNIQVIIPRAIDSLSKHLLDNCLATKPTFFRLPNEIPFEITYSEGIIESDISHNAKLYKNPNSSKKLKIVLGNLTQAALDTFKNEDVLSVEELIITEELEKLISSYEQIEVFQDACKETGLENFVKNILFQNSERLSKVIFRNVESFPTGANIEEIKRENDLI